MRKRQTVVQTEKHAASTRQHVRARATVRAPAGGGLASLTAALKAAEDNAAQLQSPREEEKKSPREDEKSDRTWISSPEPSDDEEEKSNAPEVVDTTAIRVGQPAGKKTSFKEEPEVSGAEKPQIAPREDSREVTYHAEGRSREMLASPRNEEASPRPSRGMSPRSDEGQYASEQGIRRASTALIQRAKVDIKSFVMERRSVYGAGIIIPQLARSAGWPKPLMMMTVNVYVFVLLNFLVQAMLLSAIQKEANVMNLFSGQPNLCDFGAPIDRCPDNPGCQGPGGSRITGPRLYNYPTWTTRTFFRDSLDALFSSRTEDIHDNIDPGEYGAETKFIRWLCCFIFVLDLTQEASLCFQMGRLLYSLPTSPQSWIHMDGTTCDSPDWHHDNLRIQLAGMPAIWKIVNICVILLPKVMLWRLTALAGINFLMETSEINDVIVNSVGLMFILQLDEAICMTLMASSTHAVMELVEELPVDMEVDDNTRTSVSGADLIQSHYHGFNCEALISLLPWRLLSTLALTAIFVLEYYFTKCDWHEDGSWFASKPLHLPTTTHYSTMNFICPWLFPVPSDPKPFWRMPE